MASFFTCRPQSFLSHKFFPRPPSFSSFSFSTFSAVLSTRFSPTPPSHSPSFSISPQNSLPLRHHLLQSPQSLSEMTPPCSPITFLLILLLNISSILLNLYHQLNSLHFLRSSYFRLLPISLLLWSKMSAYIETLTM